MAIQRCKVCGVRGAKLFNGKCAPCLGAQAIERNRQEEDAANDLTPLREAGLMINTPLTHDEFCEMLMFGQDGVEERRAAFQKRQLEKKRKRELEKAGK